MKPWELFWLEWTPHALERAGERNVDISLAQRVVWFARKLATKTGRVRCRLDEPAVEAARCEGLELGPVLGLVVILEGVVVVTVFWERR